MKLQESNAGAQRGEQQKAVNMLDITGAATFRPAAFLQDLGTSHTFFYLRLPLLTPHITAVSCYTLTGHNLSCVLKYYTSNLYQNVKVL